MAMKVLLVVCMILALCESKELRGNTTFYDGSDVAEFYRIETFSDLWLVVVHKWLGHLLVSASIIFSVIILLVYLCCSKCCRRTKKSQRSSVSLDKHGGKWIYTPV